MENTDPHPALLHYFLITCEVTRTVGLVGPLGSDRPEFVLCESLTSCVTLDRNLSSLKLDFFISKMGIKTPAQKSLGWSKKKHINCPLHKCSSRGLVPFSSSVSLIPPYLPSHSFCDDNSGKWKWLSLGAILTKKHFFKKATQIKSSSWSSLPFFLWLLHNLNRSGVEPGTWLTSTNISWQVQKVALPKRVSSRYVPVI